MTTDEAGGSNPPGAGGAGRDDIARKRATKRPKKRVVPVWVDFLRIAANRPNAPGDQDFAERQRDEYEKLMKESKNPLYIWLCIDHCRACGIQIPEFCINYICESAILIRGIINDARMPRPSAKSKEWTPRITTAEANRRFLNVLLWRSTTVNPFRRIAKDADAIEAAALKDAMEHLPPELLDRSPNKSGDDVVRHIQKLHSLGHRRRAVDRFTLGARLRNL